MICRALSVHLTLLCKSHVLSQLILITTLCSSTVERGESCPFLKPILVKEVLSTLLMSKTWHFVCSEQHCIQCMHRPVRDKKPQLGFQPRCYFLGLTSQDLSFLPTEWWRNRKNRKGNTQKASAEILGRVSTWPCNNPLLAPRTNRKQRGEERERYASLPPVPAMRLHPGDLGFSNSFSTTTPNSRLSQGEKYKKDKKNHSYPLQGVYML